MPHSKSSPLIPFLPLLSTLMFGITSLALHSQPKDKVIELSLDQDDLAADVQEMIDIETNEKIITLFEQIENLMGEVTDQLEEENTSAQTIAAQTHIIEKIYQAAKEKAKKPKDGSPQDNKDTAEAMLQMMERMLGLTPQAEEKKKGKQGDSSGQGNTGTTDKENDPLYGKAAPQNHHRSIPKTSAATGQHLPQEFQSALDAYNKAK